MTLRSGLFSIGRLSAEEVRAVATAAGYDLYVLSTPTGASSEFFESARGALPLDPPVHSENWDAFIDSLHGGIGVLDGPGVVIVWADASKLQARSPIDFRIAMACLDRVTEHVTNVDATERPKPLSVFVDVGAGDYSATQWGYVIHEFEYEG